MMPAQTKLATALNEFFTSAYQLSSGKFYKGGYIDAGQGYHYVSIHHYEAPDIAPTTNFEIQEQGSNVLICTTHGMAYSIMVGYGGDESIVVQKVIDYIDSFNWRDALQKKEDEMFQAKNMAS